MGDHNYVNNWPDHSKLLLSATHLEREREREREEGGEARQRTHTEERGEGKEGKGKGKRVEDITSGRRDG